MPQLSNIQASPEELLDYYAELRAQHVTPEAMQRGRAPTYGAGGIRGRRLCDPPSWLEPSRPNAGFCA